MRRYDQTRFIAFGLLPAINAIALLLLGLSLSTHGTGGAGRSVPLVATLAIASLLCAMVAAIKRGRDIGWSPLLTIAAFWVMLGTGPILLLLIAYLTFAKSTARTDCPDTLPEPATALTWIGSILCLIAPWLVFLAGARII